jgi:hypothetical protein
MFFPGIFLQPSLPGKATLNRITANNNQFGVGITGSADAMIANSVISNNSSTGLGTAAGITSLAKAVISGNAIGVNVVAGTLKSYGDNYLNDNTTPVMGSLTPVGMQ